MVSCNCGPTPILPDSGHRANLRQPGKAKTGEVIRAKKSARTLSEQPGHNHKGEIYVENLHRL
jgi:hypothetical protein